MKKKGKKFISNWTKLALGVTLYNPFMYGNVFASDSDKFFDSSDAVGVTVKVKSEDAERLKAIDTLRRKSVETGRQLEELELEVRKLRADKAVSQKELIELTQKFQEQNKQYRQLRLVLSGALAGNVVRSAGEREEQLLKSMSDIVANGCELADKSVKFCELVENITRDLPIGKVKQAELQLKLEELTRDSRRFISLAIPRKEDGTLHKCRIIAVNRDLSVVVLPVGSVHGAFNGLMYYSGKSQAVLKVVSVRPFVAAAQLIAGNIDDLAPGMELVTQK